MRSIVVITFVVAVMFIFGVYNDQGRKSVTELNSANWSIDEEKDKKMIREALDKWCEAEAERDLDKKMTIFTEDAVVMFPGEDSLRGRKEIKAKHKEWWKDTKYECTSKMEVIKLAGDWGVSSQTFSGKITFADGKTQNVKGKAMTIWEREGEECKYTRGIWNSSSSDNIEE